MESPQHRQGREYRVSTTQAGETIWSLHNTGRGENKKEKKSSL